MPRPADRHITRSTIPDDPDHPEDLILDGGHVIHAPRRAVIDLTVMERHGHRMGRLLFLWGAAYLLHGDEGVVEADRVWREDAA